MNIIGNDCVAANIYKLLDKKFNNPFMWTIVNCPNMIYLLNNFDKINFSNFRIDNSTAVKDTFKIIIDNKVNLHYVHYKFDKDANAEYKIDGDVFSKNIKLKVIESYSKRVYRMLENNEEPVFVINTYNDSRHQYTKENVIKLLSINKYKKIVITPYEDLLKYNSDYNKIIIDKSIDGQITRCTKLFDEIKDKLIQFKVQI